MSSRPGDQLHYALPEVSIPRFLPGWLPAAIGLPVLIGLLVLGTQPPGFWWRTRWITEVKLWYGVLVISGISLFLALLRAHLAKGKKERYGGEWLAGAIVLAVVNPLVALTIYPPGIHKHYNYVKCHANLSLIGTYIQLYCNEHSGAFPDRLEELVLNEDLSPDTLTCLESGDSWLLGGTRDEVAAKLAQGGHVSYLYFGQGLNSKTVAGNTLIACDKRQNHEARGYDCLALFANGSVQAIPRAQLEKMIAARKAAMANGGSATKAATSPAKIGR